VYNCCRFINASCSTDQSTLEQGGQVITGVSVLDPATFAAGIRRATNCYSRDRKFAMDFELDW